EGLGSSCLGDGQRLFRVWLKRGSGCTGWANEAWGSYWSWDPKETWALIT
ncbi:unnamed protein product, partial [Discosporangium mesarthrocarpum]